MRTGLLRRLVGRLCVLAGAAGATPAQAQNAVVDLADVDVSHALVRVGDVADGETIPVSVGGLAARRNADPGDDFYVYFDVADDVLFARTPREVYVTFHYFDNAGVVFRVQYDSTTAAYKDTAGFATTGTNVWKVHTVVLRDVLFANRQNGGADFRIAAQPGATFYVDLAYVRVPAAHMPIVRISPAQHPDVRPQPWRDLCNRWSEWPTVRSRTEMLGSADHILNSIGNAELADCFDNINASDVSLSVEVPVLKETAECPNGPACFDAHVGIWDRFVGLGARIGSFYLDEPFFAVRTYRQQLPYTDAEAVNQVVAWMRLVRQRYPHAQIIHVEPYPALSAATLSWWLSALHAACAAHGVPVLDFFVLDHDWAAPGWNFAGIRLVQSRSRALAIPFGVLFWASNQKNSTGDTDWQEGLTRQGRMYRRANIFPDLYDINDFMAIPRTTVPETEEGTFTRSVRRFTTAFVRRRY
jgi:hypothetical protein